ncbi:hypothetical protein [Clostridium tagluense]|uniref:Uncharacterized protein n=1 Tax=Clostridium tagluense TaxID=360422 RepID=A0A401UQE8_9CLOT|nr:hypothetical protein [Clostridium tagluense]GCD11759.1 hypothetical protein Ctaglu_33820 [Clostridium tagluense]
MKVIHKHKVIKGFPCKNKVIFTIITEDYGKIRMFNKRIFDEAMADGFIEVEHDAEEL